MSVLSDLFQAIADAIREKTGGTATFPPADFPEEIGKIVVGGSSGGVESLHVAEGTFGNLTTPMTARQIITHGLGTVPDFIVVMPVLASTQINETAEAFAVGFRSKFSMEYKSFVALQKSITSDDGSTGANMATGLYKRGMDETTAADRADGVISTPDENTFQVGGGTDYPLFGVYRWLAIAGMGANVVYPNAEEQKF